MSINDDLAVLRAVPLFSSLDDADLNLIAFASSIHRFRQGETVIAIGEEGTCAYVILLGEVGILLPGPEEEKRIAVRGGGAIIGEVALLCDVPRTATVKALSDVEALKIEQSEFLTLLHDRPAIAVELCKSLAMKLETLSGQID